jgi:hypothetical protein
MGWYDGVQRAVHGAYIGSEVSVKFNLILDTVVTIDMAMACG